jgi:hypothetical protein
MYSNTQLYLGYRDGMRHPYRVCVPASQNKSKKLSSSWQGIGGFLAIASGKGNVRRVVHCCMPCDTLPHLAHVCQAGRVLVFCHDVAIMRSWTTTALLTLQLPKQMRLILLVRTL